MKKLLKRFALGFLALIILITGGVYILITFYKKDLEASLAQKLKETYGLHLDVRKIDVSIFSNWPHVSIKLDDIVLSNEMLASKTSPLLKAGSISLSFDFRKLLQKKFVVKYVSISDATINMLRDAEGNANFEFKKQDSSTSGKGSGIDFGFRKLTLRKTKFSFKNLERGQDISIDFLNNTVHFQNYADGFSSDVEGSILVQRLLFNPRAGEFFKYARAKLALRLNYFKDEKRLCIRPGSFLNIENQNYYVTTLLDLSDQKRLALYIESKKIKYEQTARLLTPRIQKTLSNFEVRRPFNANVLLLVNLGKREEPALLVNIDAVNSDLSVGTSKIPYSELSFKGKIVSLDSTRTRGDMEHARITFSPIIGKLYDFPFTASVTVSNLKTPRIAIQAGLDIEAKKIKFKLEKEFVLNGRARATLSYSGPAKKLNRDSFLDKDMSLKAELTLNNLSYRPKNTVLEYVLNGKASVDNKNLKFNNLVLQTAIGNAVIKGGASNFINYVLGYSGVLSGSLTASSQRIDLNPLLVKKNKAAGENQKTKRNVQKIKESNVDFSVALFARQLTIRSVQAQNATINLQYKNRTLNILSMNMSSCDGFIAAKGTMDDFSRMKAEVMVKDVNVVKLFTQFENFGQSAITAENLQGKLDMEAKFKADLDEKSEIIAETMEGDVKLKLKEGHLINFEPVQNLSNFLFKNRDFNDVTFTDLNENFSVKGYEMKIEELEIASNVLNLYVVGGTYNFRGHSNLNLLIPWNNLKRRGKDYVPKNIGESAENVRGLKLNCSGPSKKMKITLGHKNLN